MPKFNRELTPSEVKRLTTGTHFVGGVGGLTLIVGDKQPCSVKQPSSWVLRVYTGSLRRNLGLGSYPGVSLAEARIKAKEIKAKVSLGIDPRLEKANLLSALRDSQSKLKTFKECAIRYLEIHSGDFRNAKHAKQWRATLETYAFPHLGNLLVSDATLHDVVAVLQPIWISKNETAKRLQGRIEKVFDYAISSGYRTAENPSKWRGSLSIHLAAPSGIKDVRHQPSLPYKQLPVFMQSLKQHAGIAARALEFQILTGVRSGTVRQAKWTEISFEDLEWRIPKENTKTRAPHRVPLTLQMVTLLKSIKNTVGIDYIFPSPTGRMLSDMALTQLMRKMRASGELEVDAVPHGFRSSFKVWAVEQTTYSNELSEIVLMHKVGNSIYEAYQRSDLFVRRKDIMRDWNDFACSTTGLIHANVRMFV